VAYRADSLPRVRRAVDRLQQRVTGRPDWSWLRLSHVLLPLVLVTVANVLWAARTVHCADDSLAILVSGQAALHGHDPFSVLYCGATTPDPIPYGLAEVPLNALGALSGSFVGVWVVWQALALAVVPIVWAVGGPERRYRSVLAATSIVYLPNIATNIGVENAIVAVATLLGLYAVGASGRARRGLLVLAAFLSTARFPAVFGVLGAAAADARGRLVRITAIVATFAASVGVSVLLWGRDAVRIVYLSQFSRSSGESLNVFALLVHEGWIRPSLVAAAVQGTVLLALVGWVSLRGYSPVAACAVPMLGVMALSQYLTYHFVVWLVPVLLLGTGVNAWLLVYGTVMFLDESVAYASLAVAKGIWWPYEVTGVLLSALLLVILATVVRDEERRRRAPRVDPPRASTGIG